MEYKIQPESSLSKDQLQQGYGLKARSSLLPQIRRDSKKSSQMFKNGYANQRFFNRYVRSEYILAGAVTVNLLLILIYFQMNIQEHEIKNWLLYMTTVLQFFCIFVLVINYIAYNEYKTQENRHYQLKKPTQLAFYAFILLIKPYPFLESYFFSFENQLFTEMHKVNDLLCIFSLLEVFLIVPSMFFYSKFQSLRSQRISEMYGAKASYIYAVKCWFKENSAFAVTVAFVLWFMVCVLAIRMAEYHSNNILKSFQNSVWFTFITMMTVGLGDLKPITNIGYIVNTITMYSGVIFSSVALMLLRNIFELSPRERRTLVIMNSLEEKQQLRVVACSYIRQSLWRLWKNKENRRMGSASQPASFKERNLREQFKKIRRHSQKVNYHTNIKDEFINNFAKIYGYINNLNDNQDVMLQFLHTKRS